MDKLTKKQKAKELFNEGLSYGKIANQIDVAKSTVHRWINNPNGDLESVSSIERHIGTIGTHKEMELQPNGTNVVLNGTSSTNELNEMEHSKNKKAFLKSLKIAMPIEFVNQIVEMLSEYLAADNQIYSIGKLFVLQDRLIQLQLELDKWARFNQVHPDNISDMKLLTSFFEEVSSQKDYCIELDTEYLELGRKWKRSSKKWLKKKQPK